MAQMSLYDVLLINQNATLDEIKLAFKRRALQVHPDKGGSKEEFHLVYQALETFGDPAARKKYDHGLATKTGISTGSRQKKRKRADQNAPSCKAETKTKAQTFGKKSTTSADKARTGHEAARHDHGLATTKTGPAPHAPYPEEKKRKREGKHAQPAASCKAETKPKPQMPERRETAHEGKAPSKPPRATATSAEPQSKQTKLLMKIRDLLKKLPRDARNDVITNQFSHKQRILLEKWMVDNMDTSSGTQVHSEAGRPAPPGKSAPNHPGFEIPQIIAEFSHGSRMALCDSNSSEAVAKSSSRDAICKKPATLSRMQASVTESLTSMAAEKFTGTKVTNPAMDEMHDERSYALVIPNSKLGHTPGMLIDSAKRSKVKAQRKTKASNSRVQSTGSLQKAARFGPRSALYVARIRFDSLEMNTGNACDLKTALEDLMVLTAVKQKMRNHTGAGTFVERLQAALASSSAEHGRSLTDLKLSFMVCQSAGCFIGTIKLRSPSVRSLEVFGKMRSLFEPFRQYAKHFGRHGVYWHFSPAHLEDAWERLQSAAAESWRVAGVDSTAILQKLCSLYEAQAPFRSRSLQRCEQHHMARQDKNKHRPWRLPERNPYRLECWERRQMAMEDKNEHRPKKLQQRNPTYRLECWERRQMAMEDKNKHRPKKLRERNPSARLECWERRQMAMEDKNKHRPSQLRERNPTASLECWERRQMAMEDKNKHRPKKLRERNPSARLEWWERQQTTMEDKNKHRPSQLRERNPTASLECWERRQMAMEDKNKHRPKKLRERNPSARLECWERQQMTMEGKNKHRPKKMRERNPAEKKSRQLSALKNLIARWGRMLKREAKLVEEERQNAIRQRKAQQKKDQEERKQMEVSKQKRQREEERLRREGACKRRRSDITMDDIRRQKASKMSIAFNCHSQICTGMVLEPFLDGSSLSWTLLIPGLSLRS